MSYRYRKLRDNRSWTTIGIAGFAVLVISAVIAYLAIKGSLVLEKPGGKEGPAAIPIHESKEFKYRFQFPAPAWKQDNQTRIHLKANCLAMKRSNPDAWLSLAARDFKSHGPEKEEVIQEIVKRLNGYFKDLEWDHAPDGYLAQKTAWIIVFQGKAENKLMRGECYILAHRNFTYWFTTWCPSSEAAPLAPEWPKIREGFGLLNIQQE